MLLQKICLLQQSYHMVVLVCPYPCTGCYSIPLVRARSRWVTYRLRSLIFCGVTSTNSSLLMKSRDCSRLMIIGGVRRTDISEVEERIFVFCFSLHTFTTMSIGRAFNPTIMPSYTGVPGSIKVSPRCWALFNP